jgi:pimeloyl-ACP methyl ester carboxylesterase
MIYKNYVILFFVFILIRISHAQFSEIFLLKSASSKDDTIQYTRYIQFDNDTKLFHVADYFETGQQQMDAYYSSLDKMIKESYQCNYHSNTKEGPYSEWYQNGQLEFYGQFQNGLRCGVHHTWYKNGQMSAEETWKQGQLHGRVTYWSQDGKIQFRGTFQKGLNVEPDTVIYPYLTYLPENYESNPDTAWPLILYLHGGSQRGKNLKRLYDSGIPDQIYRGRQFPFIIVAPQCPKHLRWSTDYWFDNLFEEILRRFRVDTTRVYLTGESLGGAGTWYIAITHPERFAAIAPISGFTSRMAYIYQHLENLKDKPVWAFHGEKDRVVPVEETENLIAQLRGINPNLRNSIDPDVGHWMHWLVYPGQELYDWFLMHTLPENN